MKNRISIILIFLSLSIGLFGQVKEESLGELEWILGIWERQNGKPGMTQHERWWKISDHEFKGIGIRMIDSDTVFVEKLCIKIEDGDVYYIADVDENPEPVYFKFSNWGEKSFVSENPEHDAPKKIEYLLNGNLITTKVSWDNGGFEVVFMKME